MSYEMNVGGGTAQPSVDGEKSGIEQRISELTAKFYETDRKLTAVVQENSTLKEIVSMQRQAAAPPPPPSPLDAQLANMTDEQKHFVSIVREMVRSEVAPLAGQMQVSQVAKMAAEAGLTPAETAAAENLYKDFARRNLPATPEDAIAATVGVLNYSQRKEAARTQQARAGQDAGMLSGGSRAPSQQEPVQQPIPDDIDNWDIDAQHAFWSKRTGRTK